MKRFFATLFAVAVALVSLVGCNSTHTSTPTYITAKDGEWLEVSSITYYLNNNTSYNDGSTTVISYKYEKYYFVDIEFDRTETTKEEYDNAPENQKEMPFPTNHVASLSSLKHLSSSVNKTFYTYRYNAHPEDIFSPYMYYSNVLKSYEIFPLKVRFHEDGSLEISSFKDYNVHE